MLSLSRDIADNQGVLICKSVGATIVLTGVTLSTSEGTEVALTASEVNDDDDALGDIVVTVIGKADVGVILRICRGMEVALTVSKVDDDGALGGVVGGLICMHDGSLYPFFLLEITFGWRHCHL